MSLINITLDDLSEEKQMELLDMARERIRTDNPDYSEEKIDEQVERTLQSRSYQCSLLMTPKKEKNITDFYTSAIINFILKSIKDNENIEGKAVREGVRRLVVYYRSNTQSYINLLRYQRRKERG